MGHKAKSITSKASSACRMNKALIDGHTATGTVKATGMDHFQKGFEKKESPATLAPLIAAAIPAVAGALSKGRGKGEESNSGGSTKVVVNNSATANSTSNSQAGNAIDPK